MSDAQQPLTGIRVLDLSGPIGAYASRLLTGLGADVLLVEPPGGDPLRQAPPERDGVHPGLLFSYYHGGQRSVVLDAADDSASPALADLAHDCDVVLVSPSPQRPLAGYDTAARTLSWAADETIVCAITPFGLTGPYRNWRSSPLVSHAMCGDMHRAGPPEGPPVTLPGRISWDEAGAHAIICVLAALLARAEVGGQLIDLSVHDVLCAKDFHFETYDVNGKAVGGRLVGVGYPPTGTWQCADGAIDVGAHQASHWGAFLDMLGHPEELAAPALADALVRREIFDGLIDTIAPLLAREAREPLVERGQAAGLPCATSNTPAQFIEDAQLAARGFFVTADDPEHGRIRLPGRPVASSLTMFRCDRPAPRLGGDVAPAWHGERVPPAELAKPLRGVRVLSFGAFVAGNTSALPLAELGADVVKIEPVARPEVLRTGAYSYGRVVTEPSGVTNTLLYAGLSRSARSLSLEIHTEAGRELFRRLVRESHVVIENFGSADEMTKWGCSFDDLHEINPELVMLSLSGYGRTGPRASYRAYATNISAFTGLSHAWGHTHGTLTDYLCSAHGVVGVLAGLAHAARRGDGADPARTARHRSRRRATGQRRSRFAAVRRVPVRRRRSVGGDRARRPRRLDDPLPVPRSRRPRGRHTGRGPRGARRARGRVRGMGIGPDSPHGRPPAPGRRPRRRCRAGRRRRRPRPGAADTGVGRGDRPTRSGCDRVRAVALPHERNPRPRAAMWPTARPAHRRGPRGLVGPRRRRDRPSRGDRCGVRRVTLRPRDEARCTRPVMPAVIYPCVRRPDGDRSSDAVAGSPRR